jgi:Trypsin
MRTYSSSDYAGAAKRLPHGLATALHRDLGISGADYLAHAAAESRAVVVTDALKASGVDILGSHMDGTRLVVNTSVADAAAVTAAGATAAIGAPAAAPLAKTFTPANGSAIYGGQQYFWYTVSGAVANTAQCSIGFPGYRTSDGAQQSVTAGHCLVGTSSATNIYAIPDSVPGLLSQSEFDLRTVIGHPASGSAKYGSGYDTGLINISSSIPETGSAQTWGYSTTGMPQDQAPIEVTGYTAAIVNADLCKSGSRTGWTCGTVTAVNQSVAIGDTGGTKAVNSIVATTCLLPGDSGGAGLIGTNAVGLDDSTSNADNCDVPGYESTFFPLVSPSQYASVTTGYGTTWRPKVTLSQPIITGPETGAILAATSVITGTVANPSYGETVSLFLDGSSTAFESASASSGTWSLPVNGISAGAHNYTVESFLGPWSHSSFSLANSFTALGSIVVAKPTISGIAKVGSTLTTRATISPAGTTPSYQWKSGTRNIGSDQATYAVQPTDLGARITVSVSASEAGYTTPPIVTSSATAAVAAGTLVKHIPVIAGARNVGHTLTATTTAWGPGTVALNYLWLRNGKAISGATHSSYRLAAADRGRKITVMVTGRLAGYATASEASTTKTYTGYPLFSAAPTPTISDTTPAVGQSLRVTPGRWTPGTVRLSYQWRANGAAISKATKSTFTVPANDVAKTITVTVTGKEAEFVTSTRTSVATARVASIPFKAVGTPTRSP